jgi:hypothetical protein
MKDINFLPAAMQQRAIRSSLSQPATVSFTTFIPFGREFQKLFWNLSTPVMCYAVVLSSSWGNEILSQMF